MWSDHRSRTTTPSTAQEEFQMPQLQTSHQSSQSRWKLNQRKLTTTHSSQLSDKRMPVSRLTPKTRFTKPSPIFSETCQVETTTLLPCKLHSSPMITNIKSRLNQSTMCSTLQETWLTTSHKLMLGQFSHQFHASHNQNAASLELEETETHHTLLSVDNNWTSPQKWHLKELEPRTSSKRVTRKKSSHQVNSWPLLNQLVNLVKRVCFQELLQKTQQMCITFIKVQTQTHN